MQYFPIHNDHWVLVHSWWSLPDLNCFGVVHGASRCFRLCVYVCCTGVCGNNQFHCSLNNLCIDQSRQCDGINDCGDWSDEVLNCPIPTAPACTPGWVAHSMPWHFCIVFRDEILRWESIAFCWEIVWFISISLLTYLVDGTNKLDANIKGFCFSSKQHQFYIAVLAV